jgi:hypothetical protein
MRYSSEIKTEPLSDNQKGLYEVLLILDEDEHGIFHSGAHLA